MNRREIERCSVSLVWTCPEKDKNNYQRKAVLCATLTCAGTMTPAKIAGCSDGRRRDSSWRWWRTDGCCIRILAIVQLWHLWGADYCWGVMRSYRVCVLSSVYPDYFLCVLRPTFSPIVIYRDVLQVHRCHDQ